MAKLTWTGSGWSIDIDSTTEIPLNGPAIAGFTTHLLQLVALVPITKLDLKLVAGDLQWSWEASDGRSWSNTLKFAAGTRVEGDFQVTDYYTIGELVANRKLRDHVAVLVQQFGATKIKARW